ncbi:polysaccharide deacetylase family protein [Anaerorhabdus furcosa]|uniref:Polysaccharide deacetylase n=1 Tax=Anaerorhabdus furcosa TaxID=118967 RepID=A0A1T4LUA3_9FIRM|nr:polysaccharide deacetylase family protein [Anaerorhabdus furcosa]SJZ58034.1 Polysaccharide deacetylase [Anaerorhabdus furcosa]
MIRRILFIIYQRIYTLFRSIRNDQFSHVLMFHNISNENNDITISKENFYKLITKLNEEKRICKIEDLKYQSISKSVVITFDDVFQSVYVNAYPLLKRLQVPYLLFLNIKMLDKDNYLTTEQIKEMLSDSNCILGSHSINHIFMRNISEEKLQLELLNSKKFLEKKFDVICTSFAFPYGSLYACSKKNIIQASKIYDYVFTTINMSFDGDFHNIPRINVNNNCKFLKEMIK